MHELTSYFLQRSLCAQVQPTMEKHQMVLDLLRACHRQGWRWRVQRMAQLDL